MARPTSIRAKRPLALVLVGLLVAGSAVLAVVLAEREQRAEERQDRALAREAVTSIQTTLGQTIAGLRAAGGIVAPDGQVSRDSFAAYSQGLLDEPGISVIGLSQVVDGSERAEFEAQAKYPIRDVEAATRLVRAARRDEYYPVTAVEPETRAARAILGFDIGGYPMLGPTARRARDRGAPTLTPPLQLTTDGRPGVVIIAPLYRLGARTSTIAERRRSLVGLVSTSYGVGDLVGATLGGLPEGAEVTVVDDGMPVVGAGRLADGISTPLRIGGRTWTVDVHREGRNPYLLAGLVFGSGGLLAILVWGLFAQARRREQALEEAHEEERLARREAVAAERRTSDLQALTADLARCRTRRDVISVAIDRAATAFDSEYALAGLVDARGAYVRVTGSSALAAAAPEDAVVPLVAPWSLCTAVRTGAPVWIHGPGEWVNAVPPELAPAMELGAGVCLPLAGGAEAGGVLVLGLESSRGWDEADRALAEAMAGQVGLALQRAHLEAQEHELVETLQRTLMPAELPPVEGLDLAGCYEPASEGLDVGGDWYDAVELPDGRLALVVGDVVGHGPAAAAVMGQLRSALRAFLLERGDPAAALRSLAQFAVDPTHATGATAVCVVLDPASGTFEYARAGHPPPLVVRADGSSEVLDDGRGIPLGVFVDTGYASARGSLATGDILVLYSDGAVERRGESIDRGIERLALLVAEQAPSPRDLCDRVRDTLRAEGPLGDDVALVLAQRVVPAMPRVTSVSTG